MFCVWPLLDGVLQLQRADAEQIAGGSDQRGTAPIRMRRRGKDRFVEDVFPIAGEFLFGDDAGRDRALPPAEAADHHALADRGIGGLADVERGHVELGERLHQAKPGLLIVAEHMARHRTAVTERNPDRLRFGNQIADGQHQAVVANEDAVAGALGAERLRGECVRWYGGMQSDHGRQRVLEIEAVIIGLRLRGGRHLPVA